MQRCKIMHQRTHATQHPLGRGSSAAGRQQTRLTCERQHGANRARGQTRGDMFLISVQGTIAFLNAPRWGVQIHVTGDQGYISRYAGDQWHVSFDASASMSLWLLMPSRLHFASKCNSHQGETGHETPGGSSTSGRPTSRRSQAFPGFTGTWILGKHITTGTVAKPGFSIWDQQCKNRAETSTG